VSAPDFIAIGHVTLDRFEDDKSGETRVRPGGSALYAAVTAQRLGLSVGLLTSHADDFPLDEIPPAIEVVSIEAAETTTFEHRYDEEGHRTLVVHATADPLTPEHLPDDWREAPLVLLAPVAAEVDPRFAAQFPDAAVGVSMQGWLRQSGEDHVVTPVEWHPPAWLLDRVAALFMSVNDVRGLEEHVTEWLQRVPIAVLTAGRDGALLYVSGDRYDISALPTEEVDATGAGDVFAATFMVRQRAGDDPWEAARAAAVAAAMSVCGEGFSSVPTARGLASALADYHRLRDAAP
jgi:sugar/nucleoside kinase (ribokinase family)